MPKLQSNGIELEYDEFGSPFSPPVLLIMGLGMQMLAWSDELCTLISKSGYRVIRFDNRDVGLSEKMHGQRAPHILKLIAAYTLRRKIRTPYALEDLADDALGVLDALQIQKAHIVGASMGGMISQILTAKHPERVLSLTSIMSSSGRRGLPRPSNRVIKHMFLDKPDGSDVEAAIWHGVRTFQLIGSPDYQRPEKAWYQAIKMLRERSTYPAGFFRQLAAVVVGGDRSDYLALIETPTLIIHGKDDPLVPVEHGIDTAELILNSKLEIIDGMGHDLPPKLTSYFVDLLLEHFDTVD